MISTHQDAAQSRRGGTGLLGVINRVLYGLIGLALLTVGALSIVPEIQRHQAEKKEVSRLQSEVSSRHTILAKLEKELRFLKTEPGYVELLARDRLDQMRENETIFRLEDPAGTSPPVRR